MKNVAIKLYNVMKDLDPMKKNHTTNTGKSRKISEVLEYVHPLLEKHGLIFIPVSVRDYKQGNTTTKSGAIASYASYIQTFNLICVESGESITIEVPTEGQDSGGTDKATRVANSYAMKTALENMFMIVEKEVVNRCDKPSLPNPINGVELPSPKNEIIEEKEVKLVSSSSELFEARSGEQKTFLKDIILLSFKELNIEPTRDQLMNVWNNVNGKVNKNNLEESVKNLIKNL